MVKKCVEMQVRNKVYYKSKHNYRIIIDVYFI
jgi:hypothetical protein